MFSSSCISEFFDAREYATASDGVPSEYSSDEDIGSEGENEDSISEDDEEEVRILFIFDKKLTKGNLFVRTNCRSRIPMSNCCIIFIVVMHVFILFIGKLTCTIRQVHKELASYILLTKFLTFQSIF